MVKVQKTALLSQPYHMLGSKIILFPEKVGQIGRFRNKIKEISGTENVDCRFMLPDSTVVRYVECRLGPGRLTVSPNVECRSRDVASFAGISSLECSCINGSKIIYTLHLHSTFFYAAPSFGYTHIRVVVDTRLMVGPTRPMGWGKTSCVTPSSNRHYLFGRNRDYMRLLGAVVVLCGAVIS